jgi:hypothetical protein
MNRRVEPDFPYPIVVAGARVLLDEPNPVLAEVASLRARAKRYRILVRCLSDHRVITAVEACASELEDEADRLERLETSRL